MKAIHLQKSCLNSKLTVQANHLTPRRNRTFNSIIKNFMHMAKSWKAWLSFQALNPGFHMRMLILLIPEFQFTQAMSTIQEMSSFRGDTKYITKL